jgi:ubiquinone/menaquinone biosynthesis C-methylase UbiE
MVLDIGCGPGMQTLQLVKLTDGKITALDRHVPFLQDLEKRRDAAGLGDRIETLEGDMFALPFSPASFDLIWSEGAIYIIGFERGLQEWKEFLKPRGYLVVTEPTWLVDHPPDEIKQFWADNYPAMKTIEQIKKIVAEAGYSLAGSFTLPESDWWTNYYSPLEKRVAELREKQPVSDLMAECLDLSQQEVEMYRAYSAYYGYTFFVMQRND